MKTVLAYRFSAFGDVAMTASVFRELVEQNPELKIVMVSREGFRDLFNGIPNLVFKGIDLDQYKGFFGMRKLAKELKSEFHPDYIADLHDVIRTKILTKIFRRNGFNVFVIDKGKTEKDHLTNVWNIDKEPIKPTVERYGDVFRKMGFGLKLSNQYTVSNPNKSGIGIAPFAQHKGKILSLDKLFELARIISKQHKVYFFGGGKEEIKILEEWEARLPNTESLAGKMTLKQELEKIAGLELMISMDSANMHLASLVGTRCVSIWGATHPFAGFLGYGQSNNDVVEIKDLTCRPCSVFGDKECYRGDYACLAEIKVQQIVEKII